MLTTVQYSSKTNPSDFANERTGHNERNLWMRLKLAGVMLLAIFLVLFLISTPFEFESEMPRPTLAVVSLLLVATVVAAIGLRSAIQINDDSRRLLLLVVCVALSVRAIAVLTTPILEIDYYRYLWDGKVAASGISPYQYSPQQVLEASGTTDPQLQQLFELSVQSKANRVILERIHFENITTIYPPVSQFFFAASMKWFPSSASVMAHVMWLKTIVVLFDLLTMGVVYLLLVRFKFHRGWLIGYAWNPLVIMELANSGHLDSIAVFFLMLGVYFATGSGASSVRPKIRAAVFSGLALGLGVGAKLFPIVLFPAILVTFARSSTRNAIAFALVFGIVSIATLSPMVISIAQHDERVSAAQNDPNKIETGEGLSSFLARWQMNDALFAGIYRNLKPDSAGPAEQANNPWYVMTSNKMRQRIDGVAAEFVPAGQNSAFFLTRVITLTLFGFFYAYQLVMIYRSNDKAPIDRFLWIMVVFLFVQPTVNPWYWTWIAPLACLARNRAWLPVSGLVLIYYSRFWFDSLDQTFHGRRS